MTGLRDAVAAFQRGDLDRARALAERQLEADPGSAQAQHLLGLIDCRAGRLSEGVAWLRRAFESESGNVHYRLMLARALVDSGRAAEALEVAEAPRGTGPEALAQWTARAEAGAAAGDPEAAAEAWLAVATARPDDWRAWANLGNALASQHRWAEAGDALSKAAELNPDDVDIRRNAGSALGQAGRLDEALVQLEAGAARAPRDAGTRTVLANVLAALQRHDEAIAEFEAARELGGRTVDTELGIGRRMLAFSRFDEAEAAFRSAYELDPANRAAVHQLGLALERTNRVGELRELLAEADRAGLGKEQLPYLWAVLARRDGRLEEARDLLLSSDPDEEPVAWNALRARVEDGLGNSAEAFAAATAMNRAARAAAAKVGDIEEFEHNAVAYRAEQRELARTITPEWAARVPVLDEPSPRRVAFLLGFPRSGTTLLDTFLLGHPQVAVLEERQLVGAAAEVTGPIAELPNVGRPLLARARATYLARLAEEVGEDFDGLVIDKNPLDIGSLPLIHAMFPGAPIIFALRHPCDVVLSGFMQRFGLVNFSDLQGLADYYDALMSIWTASCAAFPLNVHSVAYERLVEDPEAVLRPLVAFLGLEWTDALLDHRRTARARGTIVTPSYDQVTEPLSKAPVGKWRRYEQQLAPVLPVLRPWVKRFGYAD